MAKFMKLMFISKRHWPLLFASFLLFICPAQLYAQTEGEYLYNVTLLRAAPGHFADLVSTLEESIQLIADAGDESPLWIQHSQGDHWDFMLIYPMENVATYHQSRKVDARTLAWQTPNGQAITRQLDAYTSYKEEWFAQSIALDELKGRFEETGLFHIEMFAGLPGKRTELLAQRRMENRYYAHLSRPQNVIFTRVAGSNWDAMTIGFRKDLQAFAAGGVRYTNAQQDEAAKVAGFDGVDAIGPYLRSLLSYHNDTLGVPAR